jgi:hypothetical protein
MSFKDIARIIRPENKLKKKIGSDVNMREILQPDVVQVAQQVIVDKKDDFLGWTAESLQKMEAAHYGLHHGAPDPHALLATLTHHAESLRDRSGTFGYHLGSDIAKLLARYCALTSIANEHLALIARKHLDGLQIVFKENVKDSGGAIGMELTSTLKKLVEKYPPA